LLTSATAFIVLLNIGQYATGNRPGVAFELALTVRKI
jgi:hypothetical protein